MKTAKKLIIAILVIVIVVLLGLFLNKQNEKHILPTDDVNKTDVISGGAMTKKVEANDDGFIHSESFAGDDSFTKNEGEDGLNTSKESNTTKGSTVKNRQNVQ